VWDLVGALRSLEGCLLPDREILRMTFADDSLAAECDLLGFRLNYRLFRIIRNEAADCTDRTRSGSEAKSVRT
jgi:hypothetical protein